MEHLSMSPLSWGHQLFRDVRTWYTVRHALSMQADQLHTLICTWAMQTAHEHATGLGLLCMHGEIAEWNRYQPLGSMSLQT